MAIKNRKGKKPLRPGESKFTSKVAGAPNGRPRKIGSPEEFDALVDAHVDWCMENLEPITWTGMALALGFTSRHALDMYATYDGFSASVKRAKVIVECSYENRLHGQNATGAIFALKNLNWKDKTEYGFDEQTMKAINRRIIKE